jgi:ABC-2 type transport system ATP-binding protein
MIITKNLSKNFGSFQALSDVSFEINKGEIVGFLGRNGAGKTTLMRILTSFLPASSGTVLIDGDDVAKDSLITRQKIGYLPETPPLYLNMTVKDYLKFAAEIKGIPAKNRRRQFDSVMAECQLEHMASKTIGTLSKGYKQRVGIAQAIIHEPKLLILDEPTSGLDPIQNLQVRNLIKNLKDQRTVIISTHILSEIEHIAQRVLMIKSGEIIVDESLHSLMLSHTMEESSGQRREMNLEGIFMLHHSDTNNGNTDSTVLNHHG